MFRNLQKEWEAGAGTRTWPSHIRYSFFVTVIIKFSVYTIRYIHEVEVGHQVSWGDSNPWTRVTLRKNDLHTVRYTDFIWVSADRTNGTRREKVRLVHSYYIFYKNVLIWQRCWFTKHITLSLKTHLLSSPQLLQTSPILCSTWTTTSSTGKAWMRGSCTACDRLQSRRCSVRPWDSAVRGSPPLSCWGVSLPASQRASSPLLSCFCSTPSVHLSVHTETTEGLPDR